MAAEEGLRKKTRSFFYHSVYGFAVQSELSFPELFQGPPHSDVQIRLGAVPRFDKKLPFLKIQDYKMQATPSEARLFWEDGLALWVRGGKEIVVSSKRKIEESIVRLVVLGPGFAMLLQQRGRLVLHASAVANSKEAIAFLGSSGSGKSTLAAAMRGMGYSVVTDNLLSIRFDHGIPMVSSGFPKLKLRLDTAQKLGFDLKKLPAIEPGSDKNYIDLKKGFIDEEMPLRRIYVLSKGRPIKITPLQDREILIQLIRHSCGSHQASRQEALSKHFFQCVDLAKKVPILGLRRGSSLDSLSELAEMVKKDSRL